VPETLPRYVRAPNYLPVRARVHGVLLEGHVIGKRGERVYVQYRTAMGNHLAWLPAADVERVR
jgi:hypothetical protein